MSQPFELQLRAKDGEDMLLLQGWGSSLAWKSGKTTGFTRIKLRTATDSWLVLDATPAPSRPFPRGISLDVPTCEASQLQIAGSSATLKDSSVLTLTFHWSNPLTPGSKGLWFHLEIEPDEARNTLVLRAEVSKFYYWSQVRGVWIEEEMPRRGGRTQTFEEFAYNQIQYSRASSKGNASVLVASPAWPHKPNVWLVDLGERHEKGVYGFGPRATKAGDEQLRAGFDAGAGNAADAPVNLAAFFGGDDAPSPNLAADTLSLACARHDHTGDLWLLEWTDVSGKSVDGKTDRLSLPVLWRRLAEHYPLGLSAARARNQFTTVPTSISATRNVTLRFSVPHRNLEPTSVRLEQVMFGYADNPATVVKETANTIVLDLGNASTTDGGRPRFAFKANDSFSYSGGPARGAPPLGQTEAFEEPFPSRCVSLELVSFDAAGASGATRQVSWLLGGVSISAEPTGGSLEFNLDDGARWPDRRALECHIKLEFGNASYFAAGQDPEEGFETLAGWLDRPRPISIDVSEAMPPKLDMKIVEMANATQSRLIEIELKARLATQMTFSTDVVVIDPTPLTVARVTDSSQPEDMKAPLAIYRDDSETPAGWDFFAGTGAMHIVLPPQVVGEEMIKGRLALPAPAGQPRVEIPAVGEPFQYRFSPNAILEVDRTDIDMARTTPTWMLRRILGRRDGVTGVGLKHAAFEMVYGLTTEVRTRGLRLAELDALIGRIPFANELLGTYRKSLDSGKTPPTGLSDSDIERRRYAARSARWIHDLLYRPSWLPLFRELGQREALSLADGVKVTQRAERRTANPFRIDQFWKDDPADKTRPLRGGVDWPFQSANVYEAFKRRTESTSALLEGVAFGPLGAEGHQSASFDNGKTIIISKTRQGHLDSLVLMRIGRIAMLYNKARHVIVYQRSSRAAPRYKDGGKYVDDTFDKQSDDWDGFMALRKVREYVEITQPRRTYPDFKANVAAAGPVTKSAFETTVIPVMASWARDVEYGQVIGLRGPVKAGEERFFPRPKIFIHGARTAGKGGGDIPSECADPSQLHFFTSTRDEDGEDTDLWPAFPGIDAPWILARLPSPTDRLPSFAGSRRQPDAQRAEIGQAAFTIDLLPSEEATNLMHGRQADALEARLTNISLARLLPNLTPPKDSAAAALLEPLANSRDYILDKLAELVDYGAEHAARVSDPSSPDHARFRAEAATLIEKIKEPAEKLGEAIKVNVQSLKDNSGAWEQRQAALGQTYVDNATRQLARLSDGLGDIAATINDAATGLDNRLSKAIAAVQETAVQAQARIRDVSSVADFAVAKLHEVKAAATYEIGMLLERAQSGYLNAIADARNAVALNAERLEDLDIQWRIRARELVAGVEAFLDRVKDWLSDLLGPLFSAAKVSGADANTHEPILEAVYDAIAVPLASFGAAIEEFPPFTIEEPDWVRLESFAKSLAIDDTISRVIDSVIDDLVAKIGATEWRREIDALAKSVGDAAEQIVIALRAGGDVVGEIGSWATKLKEWSDPKQFDAIKLKLVKDITDDLKRLAGEFNVAEKFGTEVEALRDELNKALAETDVGVVAERLKAAAAELSTELRKASQQIEHTIAETLKTAAKDVLGEAGNSALLLTRALAGGVVTDTLAFTRDRLGYYFNPDEAKLLVTNTSALLNDLGAASLNAISAVIPFDSIRDRVMPNIGDIDFSSLFPDFCGLKLEHLFPELKVARDRLDEYDWLTIKHGFDKDRLVAWSNVTVDKQFAEDNTLIDLSPVRISLSGSRLLARMRVEVGEGGARMQNVSGSIKANWHINLGSKPIVTIRDGELVYDNNGRFDFKLDSEKVELAEDMRFITEALAKLLPAEDGLTITPVLPGGIMAKLSLPLPDLGTGAFTLTGITLHTYFGLAIANGFEVQTGFWLSRPDRPFGLAIVFLGGGGWVGVDVAYRPPSTFETRVSIGISAGAFIALNLGCARASAGLLFTVGVDFYYTTEEGGGSTAVTVGLLIWGEFSILSIASAYLRLTAGITYTDKGGMRADGMVSVSIRISFFYTLRVSQRYTKQFSGGGSRRYMLMAMEGVEEAALLAMSDPVAEAVELHFETLDLG